MSEELTFYPKVSRYERYCTLLGYNFAFIAIWASNLPYSLKILVSLGLLLYSGFYLWQVILKQSYALKAFHFLAENRCAYRLENQKVRIGTIQEPFTSSFLIVFQVISKTQKRFLVIFKDALSERAFHELLVYLRVKKFL